MELLQGDSASSISGYTLGGSATGLTGTLVLQNGTDTVSLNSGTTSFYFPVGYTAGTNYLVTIQSQPAIGTCSLNNRNGTFLAANVTTLEVECISSSIQGGSVTTVPSFTGTPQLTTLYNGAGNTSTMNRPTGITTDGTNLYVSDRDNHRILQVALDGTVTPLAGSSGSAGFTDGVGTAARFDRPEGLTTDGRFLYVADKNNHAIRRVEISTGTVTTVVGGVQGSLDGFGTAARLDSPRGVTTDGNNLYVADTGNHTIRKVVLGTYEVTTLAGSAGSAGFVDGSGSSARFDSPERLTTDGSSLFVTDRNNQMIRKVDLTIGFVTTLVTTINARGITTDGTNLYISVDVGGDNRIYKYDSLLGGGTLTAIAGTGATGWVDGNALTTAKLNSPRGITTDGISLYVCDRDNHDIRRYY